MSTRITNNMMSRSVLSDLNDIAAKQAQTRREMSSGKAITKLRKELNCSQAVFARVLNISPKTIQAWEQGVRRPSDAALRLLEVAEKYPAVLFRL